MTTSNTNRSVMDEDRENVYDSRSEGHYFQDASVNEGHTAANKSNNNVGDIMSTSDVPVHMNTDQLRSLKNSTKQLLCLLEEVQSKLHTTALVNDDPPKMADVLRPMVHWNPTSGEIMDRSVTDIIGSAAIKKLVKQTEELDCIVIKERDNCSIYQRLIRKCHCLNQQEYNDFIIHFNEDTKYGTSIIGEMIKNMFILKKFLYMGNKYTRNALMFLNQGLEESTYPERAEIVHACAFADICSIFDQHTIITVCISWPCKNPSFMETDTPEMAAKFLHNLTKLEEGRRYLIFNAKITCDIKKVLKKKQGKISCDTVELLNLVLNAIQPHIEISGNSGMNTLTYYCRPMQEGVGHKVLIALIAYRQYMTLNELFLHLDILQNLSGNEETKTQLIPQLPSMLSMFRKMVLELNNGDINILISNIMSNIVGENMFKKSEKENIVMNETLTSSTATEPIQKVNRTAQTGSKKNKKANYSRQKSLEGNKQEKANAIQTTESVINDRKQSITMQNTVKTKTFKTPIIFNENPRNFSAIIASVHKITRNIFQNPSETENLNRSRKLIDDATVIVVPIDPNKTVVRPGQLPARRIAWDSIEMMQASSNIH